MSPQRSYLMFTTSRSGSTLLCEALQSTGMAGLPDEYFEPAASTIRQPFWLEDWKAMPYDAYLSRVVQIATTPNGICGAKLDPGSLAYLVRCLHAIPRYSALSTHELLSTFFPNLQYLWVTRRDKIRQAVSLLRAQQTGHWNSLRAVSRPQKPLRYSYPLINEQLQTIVLDEVSMGRYFAEHHVVPFTVVYEDLVADYEGTTRAVLAFLGIPIPAGFSIPPPRVQRQSDATNDEWARRYERTKLVERRINHFAGFPTLLRTRDDLHTHVISVKDRARHEIAGLLSRCAPAPDTGRPAADEQQRPHDPTSYVE